MSVDGAKWLGEKLVAEVEVEDLSSVGDSDPTTNNIWMGLMMVRFSRVFANFASRYKECKSVAHMIC
jgi:hypothetical protein